MGEGSRRRPGRRAGVASPGVAPRDPGGSDSTGLPTRRRGGHAPTARSPGTSPCLSPGRHRMPTSGPHRRHPPGRARPPHRLPVPAPPRL